MKIIVLGEAIVGSAEKITKELHDGINKWRLADKNDNLKFYVHDLGHEVIDDVVLPDDYADEEGQYFYVNGEFVLNKNWERYTPVEEKIAALEALVASQAEEINLLNDTILEVLMA